MNCRRELRSSRLKREQAPVAEPVDPFQTVELDGLQVALRPATPDDLGLVEAVDRIGQGVVAARANASDRRLDAGFGEAVGVLDRDVLRAD